MDPPDVMSCRTVNRLWRSAKRRLGALLVLAALGTCVPTRAQNQEPTSTPEVFEKIDPYTKHKPEAIDKAGYTSLGPFAFAQGIATDEIEQTLGGLQVLWVETAHYKLGSLLQTYRRGTDDDEEKRLATELARLAKKLPRVRKDVRELDPWLRLHVWAQRLEDQYAQFQSLVDAGEAPKPDPKSSATPPRGPFLGQALKYTVLLTEKRTQLERFARRYVGTSENTWYLAPLPGGSQFVGLCAETMKDAGAPLDAALHAFVATGATYALCDGYRASSPRWPDWLRHGIALWSGRRAEPRWSVFVARESAGPDDESWHFEERLNGLVRNRFVASFEEMFAWTDLAKLEERHHMTAWSRVAWLVDLDRAAFGRMLGALNRPWDPEIDAGTRAEGLSVRQKAALCAAYGRTLPELDTAWQKYVLQRYPKK